MELTMGLIVNQPVNGVYPYWDNSKLPLNIFGQAWLVNDIFIGLASMIYIWIIFPLIHATYERLSKRGQTILLAVIIVSFLACCFLSYWELVTKVW